MTRKRRDREPKPKSLKGANQKITRLRREIALKNEELRAVQGRLEATEGVAGFLPRYDWYMVPSSLFPSQEPNIEGAALFISYPQHTDFTPLLRLRNGDVFFVGRRRRK